MLPPLRPYQVRTVEHIRQAEKRGKIRKCIQSPTGSGKTRMLSDLLLDPTPQLVLTHRKFLLDQISGVLTAAGIKHGLRASGKPTNFAAPIQLALYQTEWSRVFKKKEWPLHPCTRVHWDELHSITGPTAQTIANTYHAAGASQIGWTATPDEVGIFVDDLYVAATVPELIADGFLVPPVVFGPDMPDTNKLESVPRQANGEYSPAGLKKIWEPKAIIGRAIEKYHNFNPNHVPTIGYASGVPESLWFAQRFTASGIRSAHIDGDDVWLDGQVYESDSGARQAIFDGVAANDIRVVFNRYVLREGFDCPALGCALLLTPFGSRAAWVQSVGRILRPSEGKKFGIVIDHAGNWLRHEPIDSDEPWDMKMPAKVAAQIRVERIRSGSVREPICCPKCDCVRLTSDECPECGHRSTKRTRKVLQLNGELKLQTGPAYKQRQIVHRKDDAQVWKGIFYGNLKNHPERTPQQAWAYNAYKNFWKYLPRDLPLMPKTERGWFVPFGELQQDDLIQTMIPGLPEFRKPIRSA